MRALYFAVSMFFSLLGLGGYLAIDYFLLNQSARARGEEPISFVTYMGGWTGLAATFAEGDSAAKDLPETLVAMMPRAPEGWATAPTRLEDATPFVTPASRPRIWPSSPTPRPRTRAAGSTRSAPPIPAAPAR